MKRLGFVIAGVALTAGACGKRPSDPAATPSRAMADAYDSCTWGTVESRSYSIQSYACGGDMASAKLVPDDDVGGFAIVSSDSPRAKVVIRTFIKEAAAPASAILPAVLAATGAHGASCRLVEHETHGDWGAAWLLEPTGAGKAAYDAANAVEPQDTPCGELGVGPAGDRFFRVMPDDPSRVIYADMGSEVQIFDLSTLKLKSRTGD